MKSSVKKWFIQWLATEWFMYNCLLVLCIFITADHFHIEQVLLVLFMAFLSAGGGLSSYFVGRESLHDMLIKRSAELAK